MDGLYQASQTKHLETLLARTFSNNELMQRAGQALFHFLTKTWPNLKTVAVCIGHGNNGGDGLVLATLLKKAGLSVNVYQGWPFAENEFAPQSKLAFLAWQQMGGVLEPLPSIFEEEMIVDGLVGIGVRFPLADKIIAAINVINAANKPILAIDIPSGLNPDNGSHTVAIKADTTLMLLTRKLGLIDDEALDYVGKCEFDALDIHTDDFPLKLKAYLLNYQQCINELPSRKLNAHKGNHGHVLLIGGQAPFQGAIQLAGIAALRAGCGLASAFVGDNHLAVMNCVPELMLNVGNKSVLKAMIDKATTLILGCGLARTPESYSIFKYVLQEAKLPMIVDADGLYWLAQFPIKRDNWILTPHLKEAALLLNCEIESIRQDKIGAILKLQQKFGGIIVLKSACTFIIDEQQRITVSPGGLPVLAVGGTGDILAGLIGGLLAQGLSLSMAAQIGVSVHTMAAKDQQEKGARGMLASDLLLELRPLLNPNNNQINYL